MNCPFNSHEMALFLYAELVFLRAELCPAHVFVRFTHLFLCLWSWRAGVLPAARSELIMHLRAARRISCFGPAAALLKDQLKLLIKAFRGDYMQYVCQEFMLWKCLGPEHSLFEHSRVQPYPN